MEPDEKYSGTAWLRFYIYWRFPISFILGAIILFGSYAKFYYDRQLISSIIWFAVAIDIGVYIFRIIVYLNLKEMTEKGYNQNIALLAIESVYVPFSNAGDNSAEQFMISFIVFFFIWVLPNYIYFKHRKFMFLDEQDGPERVSVPVHNDTNGANRFFCKNCGTYSTGWYQPCPTCGAKGQMVKTATMISASSIQDDEKRKIFYCEKCGFVGSDYESKNNSCPKCASRLVKTDISRRQWLSMSETQKQNMKDQWHGGKTGPQNVQENKKSYDEVRFCRMCGSQLLPGAAFCSNCGAKVDIMSVKQNQRVIENLPEVKQLDEVQSSASYEPTGKHEGSYTSSSNKVRSSQTGEDTPKNYDIDSILKEFL